eukprot:TRINITY_DN9563_c0_g1_i1.p1 TRINITY_DN9563_c0_g1~~TRINITY_DN9563_c0_g1_i1.p1  ORF type:complete len:378 (+),score=70.69 TRINITY_DN9563_c0_g1_i1:17-1150(+)
MIRAVHVFARWRHFSAGALAMWLVYTMYTWIHMTMHNPPVTPPCTALQRYTRTGEVLILVYDLHLRGGWHDLPEYEVPAYGRRCIYTENRTRENEASLILFHAPHHRGLMPSVRKCLSQQFALLTLEPPHLYPLDVMEDKWFLMNDIFVSYQRQSDIRMAYIDRFWKHFNPKWMGTLPEKKDKLVMWAGTNCDQTANDRTEYIQELMKYIHVDSYGKCLQNKKFPEEEEKEKEKEANSTSTSFSSSSLTPPMDKIAIKVKAMREYKFYLAFENSNFDDYVTEKVYDAFAAEVVPIYMGASNIDDYIPSPDSVIKVSDYASPQALAEYLLQLSQDEDAYLKYFDWRIKGMSERFLRTWNSTRDPFEKLCDSASDYMKR